MIYWQLGAWFQIYKELDAYVQTQFRNVPPPSNTKIVMMRVVTVHGRWTFLKYNLEIIDNESLEQEKKKRSNVTSALAIPSTYAIYGYENYTH